MASPLQASKDTLLSTPPLSTGTTSANVSSASSGGWSSVFAPATNAYGRLAAWRRALDLPQPGTIENIQKEVRNTHLTNFFFDGARADLTKAFSMSPMFQVTHSFALGSQTAPSSYNFGAVYVSDDVLLQGGVDNEGSLNGRFNKQWAGGHTSKAQMQLTSTPGHSMLQVDHDVTGTDFSVNLRAVNPSPVDGTGIYMGSVLQSVTKRLALGVEGILQKPSPEQSDFGLQYYAKYVGGTGLNHDNEPSATPGAPPSPYKDGTWIATASIQPSSSVQTTYWHKLSDKLEMAADLMVINVPQRRDAIATLGARWDLRMSSFRAQLDSTGKVSALLEQRFAPSFLFLVSGEIDHFKNSAKVGVGVMIESSPLSPEEMGMVPPINMP
ncbi:eukaryotic porin-domain-containing protein [Irpex rosettiformis]|uniref:Eukaryotic porin-domain-containing protein n=1 Tax=Irpex rosettiformis TaxID=378272 RepID=A0ACB8UH02_9APHY|nr:eukaryotic porin-domain-containing protein [Irpex rosettiformis]